MNRLCSIVAVFVMLFAAAPSAQQDATVDWKVTLQELERRLAAPGGTDVEKWRADAEALRASLILFAAEHPDIHVTTPPPLSDRPSADVLKPHFDQLNAAVDEVIRQSPGSPFHLGSVTVNVTAAAAPSLVSDSIDETGIEQHNFLNIAKAFDYLPGVEIQHIANNRNEAGIMVRGFSTKGQIPFYLDGIPVSVPYDGFVDFNRFLTSDLAELQVDKGYTSPLLGPNALGGAINLVTHEPAKPFEGEALFGLGSGRTVASSLSLGSRWKQFFVQGTLDRLRVDYIPLSSDFTVRQYTGLPDITMSDRLNQSATLDTKTTGRAGWTPRAGDEYVVSYTSQHGQKGVPLYQGPNTAAAFRNFWSWPYWNMDSYYVHSATRLGDLSSLRFRAFYNRFDNAINMFSNDTYTVMNTSTAEHSVYNEHTDGASAAYETHVVPRNIISASFFLKNDVHRENGTFPGRAPFPLVAPPLEDRDQQVSIGAQDRITISERLSATLGFSADHFNGQQGESYNSALTALVPFTCIASPANTSVSGCTLHAWNYNPQASVSYQVGDAGNLFATLADRGRFPMLKDIYSASLGSALPNPNLQPEHSRNWNVGYSQVLPLSTFVQFEVFRSDLRDAIESAFVTDPGLASAGAAFCPNSRTAGFCSQMVNIASEVHRGVEFKVRSTPLPRVSLDASYSSLHREIAYDFASVPTVSQINTSITILPTLPRNKVVGTLTARLPYQVVGMVSARYENGLILQDTSYATSSPLFQPFTESFATMDVGAVVPIYAHLKVQAGIRNLLDKNYFYTAGYPEAGRNWFVNLRWQY